MASKKETVETVETVETTSAEQASQVVQLQNVGACAIRYKGKNVHDVLNMTVKEALVYFAGHPKIVDKLYVLDEVGLGYVRLG